MFGGSNDSSVLSDEDSNASGDSNVDSDSTDFEQREEEIEQAVEVEQVVEVEVEVEEASAPTNTTTEASQQLPAEAYLTPNREKVKKTLTVLRTDSVMPTANFYSETESETMSASTANVDQVYNRGKKRRRSGLMGRVRSTQKFREKVIHSAQRSSSHRIAAEDHHLTGLQRMKRKRSSFCLNTATPL